MWILVTYWIGLATKEREIRSNYIYTCVQSKRRAYESLITSWTSARNIVVASYTSKLKRERLFTLHRQQQEQGLPINQQWFIEQDNKALEELNNWYSLFDKLYGDSYTALGQLYLYSDNQLLNKKIEKFNAKFFYPDGKSYFDLEWAEIGKLLDDRVEEGKQLVMEMGRELDKTARKEILKQNLISQAILGIGVLLWSGIQLVFNFCKNLKTDKNRGTTPVELEVPYLGERTPRANQNPLPSESPKNE